MNAKYTAEYRQSQRWYPRGAMVINHPNGLGVVFAAPYGQGWQVVAYRGTAGKPEFNYSYKARELAEKKVADWFEALDAHQEYVEHSREANNQLHTLKPGDVITNSWGYDQTNIDWYRVTRTTRHFVWLKPIAAHVKEISFMSGPSVPLIDTTNPDPANWGFRDLDKPEEQHKATGNSVRFEFGSGSKWDGRERYCSWYA